MNDVPALRFSGFEDDWEQRKLGELAVFNPKEELPDVFEYVDLESVVGTEMLSHRTEEKATAPSRAQRLAHAGDLFYQTVRPYQKNNYLFEKPEKHYVFSTGYAQLRPFVDGYFLLSLIQNGQFVKTVLDNCTGTSYPAINANDLAEIEVFSPADEHECHEIGSFFRNLDNLITLHQRKHDALVNVKKSLLSKLYPKSGFELPEIRFNYKKNWVKVKLGNIITQYNDPVETPHEGYTRLGIRSFGKGTFHSYVPAGQELETAKMHRVAAHMFIVNITFGWEHAVAITTDEDAGKLVSHRFPQFAMTEKVNDRFLKYVILDERFHHHLLLSSPGGAGRNRVLSIPQMLEYELYIPQEIEEQKQIAGMLDSLNGLTDMYAEKIQKLKQLKAACLKRMFV